jgi:hypothetical protein
MIHNLRNVNISYFGNLSEASIEMPTEHLQSGEVLFPLVGRTAEIRYLRDEEW